MAAVALGTTVSLAVASKSVTAAVGGPPIGTLGGQFNGPQGVAVNNTSDVYVADANNNRVERFASSGAFISAWGFDTIQSGKPGDLGSNVFEVCTVAADCKAGINTVSPAPGGELNAPQGIAVDQATGNLYVTNQGFQRVEELSAAGAFIRAFGQDVVQAGKPGNANEVQAVTVKATAGQFKLTFNADTTSDLPFNATATEVQSALNALASVNTGGGSVTVSGGPGNETGSSPYLVTFNGGSLAEANVNQTSCAAGTTPLSGPSAGCSVATTNSGATGFEVCTVAADCKTGVAAGSAGALSLAAGAQLSVAPTGAPNAGNVLVADPGNRRVSEYTSTGAFVRSFGFDVVEAGPDNTGTTFEICKAEVNACKAAVAGAAPTGSAIGQFGNNGPLRVVEAPSGVIYTAENRAPNFRIQKFTPSGSNLTPSLFVVNNEVQSVTVKATSGQFKLTFGAGTTADLPFNATAAEVQTALNNLTSIQTVNGTPGGSVSVSGGPGDASGSSPYVVTFNGGPFISADAAQMTAANGTTSLSGGTGPGANKAVVTTTIQGAPGGTTESTSPSNPAIDASGNLVLTKGYLPGSTPNCLNTNAASIQERRVLEINPAGTLLATHLACAGNNAATGLAVNQTNGRLYFSSSFPANTAQVYAIDNVTPPSATIDPVTDFDSFSATLKGHVNPQGSPTECRFDYISKAAFDANVAEVKAPFLGAASVPCEQSPGAGSGPIAVSAQVKGNLNPNTAYVVRLVAQKPAKPFFGEVATTSSNEEFTTGAVPPPTVITGAAAPIGATTARLSGLVNPNSSPTEAHFEYGTVGPCSVPANACASTTSQSVGTAYITPGEPYKSVTADLEGLEPDTTYYYRLVATNGIGTGAGEDRTFETRALEPTGPCPNEDVRQAQHTDSYLPDCRGVELVNQPDKGNSNVKVLGGTQEDVKPAITTDGEKALWTTFSGVPGTYNGTTPPLLAERTEQGWRSKGLAPPPEQQIGEGEFGYKVVNATPDLSRFILKVFLSAGPAFRDKALVRVDANQHAEELNPYAKEVKETGSEITEDGAHVLVIDPDASPHQLQDIGSGSPETVSLTPPAGSPLGVPVPGGAPSECGLDTGGESFVGGNGSGIGADRHWRLGYHMIATTDASRVYFEAKPNGNCSGLYGLYVRNRETGTTTPIDYGADGEEPQFIRATPDGRSAYFATAARLDPADENEGAQTGGDVYRWDEEAGESTCLTCVQPNIGLVQFAGSYAPIIVSDDFSHVYFESTAQLIPGHGKAGDRNLYVLSGGEVRFVADPNVTNTGVLRRQEGGTELSRDGNVLVFHSKDTTNLTADAFPAQCLNPDPAGDALGECEELYRYDDRDGSVECISCRHGAITESSYGTNAETPGTKYRLSADGSTVAFATRERLLERDVNGGVDIYEWREGATRLLTDGVSSFPRSFAAPKVIAVDEDGTDVFFALTSPGLTGFEQDGLANLYDARIGGGFVPPSPPVHCAEDSCQGPLQAAPALGSAGSAAESRGNVIERKHPRPCAKKRGKAKRRCLRKHKRHAQRARANHNAGSAR